LLLALALSIAASALDDLDSVDLPLLLQMEGEREAASDQCSLGSAVADALRWSTGADVAVIPADALIKNLLPGQRTLTDLSACVADSSPICTVSVTPKQLKAFLEAGVSHLTLDETTLELDQTASAFDGFPQVGGLSYRCDLSAPVGSRILELSLSDGGKLDLNDQETLLTLAAPQSMLDGSYGYPVLKGATTQTVTLPQALLRFIADGQIDSTYSGSAQVKWIGVANDSILGDLPVGWIAAAAIVILLCTARSRDEFLETLHSIWGNGEKASTS
jgi:hypothetical protein